jgi:hypothetical protein
MSKLFRNYFLILLFAPLFLFTSCEDVIELKLDDGKSMLTVNAVLTNQNKRQYIMLNMSVGFFDEINTYPPYDADSVYLTNQDGKVFNFEPISSGQYTFLPTGGDTFKIGDTYKLTIKKGTEEWYESVSQMRRIAPLDSITYEYTEGGFGGNKGYLAEFHAIDPLGVGDCIWVKTYVNGIFINDPNRINVAYDAAFSPGGNNDNLKYIPPIRFVNINDFANPYQVGDKIKIELLSISEGLFYYLREAQAQITNGGLFATPPANVRSNIEVIKGPTGAKALGYFNMSAVSEMEIEIVP